MSHGDDIRAIHARNDLTVEEKRQRAYEVKGNAYRGIRGQIVNKPWTDGDLTINITSLEVDDKHRVVVQCEVWRDGAKLVLDLPFIYVNPPLVHGGNESPVAVLGQIIAETVRG